MQAKRIQVNESNLGAGSRESVFLEAPLEPREELNYHNIWGSVSVEPQNADANCQGTWILGLAKETMVIPVSIDALINSEQDNAIIIACGVFSASNQSPYNFNVHPSSSRNLLPGDRLFLSCTVTGITAGQASTRLMLCAHVTRK